MALPAIYARSRDECECDHEVDAAASNPALVSEQSAGAVSDLVVLGLGYVGLPLAAEAVSAGLKVTGLDVSDRVVDGLNNAVSHVDDLSAEDRARRLMRAGTPAIGVALAVDETGEVLARSNVCLDGYWDDSEETQRCLAGGW